jgi:hypothetical protein
MVDASSPTDDGGAIFGVAPPLKVFGCGIANAEKVDP